MELGVSYVVSVWLKQNKGRLQTGKQTTANTGILQCVQDDGNY